MSGRAGRIYMVESPFRNHRSLSIDTKKRAEYFKFRRKEEIFSVHPPSACKLGNSLQIHFSESMEKSFYSIVSRETNPLLKPVGGGSKGPKGFAGKMPALQSPPHPGPLPEGEGIVACFRPCSYREKSTEKDPRSGKSLPSLQGIQVNSRRRQLTAAE